MSKKVSKLGEYHGYSEEVYNGYKRISQYITVSDETKLAADILLPSINGQVANTPLPVIWSYIRYHRASLNEDGELTLRTDTPLTIKLLKHGYIIAAVDARGAGASFGTLRGELLPEEAQDGYDITEWLAKQSWCDGKIGMYGSSYMGITQYMTAGKNPPHLKAIIPEMAMFDRYSFIYPGGVFREGFITEWGKHIQLLDKNTKPVPVDEDHDGSMAVEAVEQHQLNKDILDTSLRNPHRDSRIEGEKLYFEWSPNKYVDGINNSNVAVYHIAGWFDLWPRDQLTWYNNLKTPQRILMTPWSHSTGHMHTPGWHEMVTPLLGYELDHNEILEFHSTEMLRWYDYWLKGIENGIMDEPSIHYYTIGAPKEKAWRTSKQWPTLKERRVSYYLNEDISRSGSSINYGNLTNDPPSRLTGFDEYTVDCSTTTGKATRWTNGYGAPIKYPDMRENDSKALTYTTKQLEHCIEVTGHPILHLWVMSPKVDVDFYAYLEEVDREGYSHYLTEGVLRVSHRALSDPPFMYMGLPYHRSYQEDVLPLKKEPVELLYDLLPISNVFDEGHRIRLAITCADKDNYQTEDLSGTKVMVHRNRKHCSYISLPIIN
jgi:putative CocE/NonD family hydrolase